MPREVSTKKGSVSFTVGIALLSRILSSLSTGTSLMALLPGLWWVGVAMHLVLAKRVISKQNVC